MTPLTKHNCTKRNINTIATRIATITANLIYTIVRRTHRR